MGVKANSPIILAWYEEADFAELMSIAGHDGDPAEAYGHWYRQAMRSVDDLLRSGQQIAFITVRPAAYSHWLQGRPNTLEMRCLYAEYLAVEAIAVDAVNPWL